MPREKHGPGGLGMLLLALLAGQDMYGYQMIEALRLRSNQVFALKAGTLYPLLHTLEQQGWVTSYDDGAPGSRVRRYYRITPQGRAALEEQKSEWNAYADAVRGVLEGGALCGA
ncbi:helix-turn-helix transcriptional regulator [Pseudoflavonifractor gallinarum]|uniref:PadR family transcriptional regulator n=1 Tax=Pseudoflavonifractor hominis TaxID=2763059 RepID=A0ABR7HPQ7_9FIRM|nr:MULTISPECIES: PadR family transcriptional regulator [Eubacteriales]MBC5729509.1 PadR family transcriptional regulator [Pseudoflavonifractor hominis]MBS5134553.1 PadR family transcriptional regulator [Oscillospiraceae bacterium]